MANLQLKQSQMMLQNEEGKVAIMRGIRTLITYPTSSPANCSHGDPAHWSSNRRRVSRTTRDNGVTSTRTSWSSGNCFQQWGHHQEAKWAVCGVSVLHVEWVCGVCTCVYMCVCMFCGKNLWCSVYNFGMSDITSSPSHVGQWRLITCCWHWQSRLV